MPNDDDGLWHKYLALCDFFSYFEGVPTEKVYGMESFFSAQNLLFRIYNEKLSRWYKNYMNK